MDEFLDLIDREIMCKEAEMSRWSKCMDDSIAFGKQYWDYYDKQRAASIIRGYLCGLRKKIGGL